MTYAHILGLYDFNEIDANNIVDAIKLAGCPVHEEQALDLEIELESFNDLLQKCFIRAKGTERQQLEEKFKDLATRAKLTELLSTFFKEARSGQQIKTRLLLGATESATHERLDVLALLEKEGIHSEKVFLLGGERDLWLDSEPLATRITAERLADKQQIPLEEAKKQIDDSKIKFFIDKKNIIQERENVVNFFHKLGIDWPTESDMMMLLSKEYEEKLSNTEFISVSAPKVVKDDGTIVRPNTLDTFIELWKDHGTMLAKQASLEVDGKFHLSIVANQPYVSYQYQVAKSFFYDKKVSVSVDASPIRDPSGVNFTVIFDSLARTINSGKDYIKKKIITDREASWNPSKSSLENEF